MKAPANLEDRPAVVIARAIKAFWVLADQGVFALSNFLINIMFARWLPATEYGWYAMSFSGCLLAMTLHSGAILEPLLVQSARVEASQRRSFVRSLVNLHLVLLLVAAALAGLAYAGGLILGNINIGLVVASGLLGSVALLTLSIGRRVCAVFVSVRASGLIGTLYLGGSLLNGLLLHWYRPIEWLDIWFVTGSWSLAASATTFATAYVCNAGDRRYPLTEILGFAGRFAPWGLASSAAGWLRSEGLLLILARFAGLEIVAETRAVFNVAAPLVQINMAAHISSIVWFSSNHSNRRRRNIWLVCILYAAATAILLPLVYWYAPNIVSFLYGGRYVGGSWQLSPYCLVLAMYGLDQIVSTVGKAQGLMLRGYASSFVAGAVSLALGAVMIPVQHTLIYPLVIASAIGLATTLSLHTVRAEAGSSGGAARPP